MTARSLARIGILASAPVILAVFACSENTTPAGNRPPVAVAQIRDQTILPGRTIELDASVYFSDPDGDELTYSAISARPDIVEASVVDSLVAIRGVARGTSAITVTATDAGGLSTSQSFQAVVEVPSGDRGVLITFYRATEGDDWQVKTNWLTDAPLGEWYGIDTNGDGRVTVVDLPYNSVSGELPPEILDLTELQKFSVHFSQVRGPVPEDIGRLSNLTELDLSWTHLSGPIPPGIADLSSLRILNLERASLSGSIPASLGNLANLQELTLYLQYGEGLTGPIPGELGRLARLRILDLGFNRLSGPIPPELGNLTTLRSLSLLRNELSGGVPPELGRLTGLRQLSLVGNSELRGELPAELTALESLETFLASETDLCAPPDSAFTIWLDGIVKRRVTRCGAHRGSAYLTQAVQSMQYPVPLVAGDSALLRVFVTAQRPDGTRIPSVRAGFYDAAGTEIHVADIPGLEHAIPAEIDQGNLETSSNAVIPAAVVQPGVEMVIEVDPDDTLDPELGVTRRIPAEGRLKLDVVEMPTFDLTVIPMLWEEYQDSAVLEITDTMTAEHGLFRRARDLLPVGEMEVTIHDPVVTGDNVLGVLLYQVARIRTAEGGTGHYMGMMTEASLSSGRGKAEIGGKASVSVPQVWPIVHELGHNFSLLHASCGRAGLPDPAYPSPTGEIGAWGYDFSVHELVDTALPDLMTYCEPNWIGEYHFTNALRYRVADEGMAEGTIPARRVLLLSGGVDADDVPFLDPAIVIDAPPSLPRGPGPYRITGSTADGAELFSLQFDMPALADGDGSSFFTFAVPVRDEWPEALAGLTLFSGARSHMIDRDTDRPLAMLRDPATGQIRRIVTELPTGPMARETAIALASEKGFEVLFSRGIPGAADWRR